MKNMMARTIYLFVVCLFLYTLLEGNKISAELSDGCPRKGKEKEPELQPSYGSENAKREINEPNYEDLDSLEMDDSMEDTPNDNVDIQSDDGDNGSPQADNEDVSSNQGKNEQGVQQNEKQNEKSEESEEKDVDEEISKYEGVFGGLPEDIGRSKRVKRNVHEKRKFITI